MSAIGTPALLSLSKAPLFAIWMGVLHRLHFPLRLAEFTQLLVLRWLFLAAVRPVLALSWWQLAIAGTLLSALPFLPHERDRFISPEFACYCPVASILQSKELALSRTALLLLIDTTSFRAWSGYLAPALLVAAARLIILARNLHEKQLQRCVGGNNTPAIMTLCFVGGKEQQEIPDDAGMCPEKQRCKRIGRHFFALQKSLRKGSEQHMALSSRKIERTAKGL
jgi:hypothetical protein